MSVCGLEEMSFCWIMWRCLFGSFQQEFKKLRFMKSPNLQPECHKNKWKYSCFELMVNYWKMDITLERFTSSYVSLSADTTEIFQQIFI